MKKLYFTILGLAFGLISAQGTESFDNFPATNATDYEGSYLGDTDGVTINCYKVGYYSTYPITGKSLTLNSATRGSYVEFEIPNGVGEFTFKYRKVATVAGERSASIYVDDVLVDKTEVFGSTSGKDETIYTKTVAINKNGSVKIKIKHSDDVTAARQIALDDISWTAYDPTMSINNIVKNDINLVKNTIVSNEILFGAKADIKIFNINGQLVKSASVNENTRLDVSSFANGIYIITGVVNGKTISQKIIKK